MTDTSKSSAPGSSYASAPFLDRRLALNAVIILGNSALLLWVIKWTDVVHWPYLLAAISAVIIGFLEPRKGWLLAVLQALSLWMGYNFFTAAPQSGADRELELFCLYGSMGLTFLGSFVGGILKRATSR